jgi:hypothetical protein
VQNLVEFEFPGLSSVVDYTLLSVLGDTHSNGLNEKRLNKRGDNTYLVVGVELDVLGSEIRSGSGSDNDFNLLVFFGDFLHICYNYLLI